MRVDQSLKLARLQAEATNLTFIDSAEELSSFKFYSLQRQESTRLHGRKKEKDFEILSALGDCHFHSATGHEVATFKIVNKNGTTFISITFWCNSSFSALTILLKNESLKQDNSKLVRLLSIAPSLCCFPSRRKRHIPL